MKQPQNNEKEVLINGINLILKEIGIKSEKYNIIQNIVSYYNLTIIAKLNTNFKDFLWNIWKEKKLIGQLEEFLQQPAGYSTIKSHEKDLFEFAIKNTYIFGVPLEKLRVQLLEKK